MYDMKTKKINPNTIMKELYLSQAYYVEHFLPTSEFLEKQGFYNKVAKFINLNQNENVIIDIGCGDCRLISLLKDIRRESTIIGIDINPLMLTIGDEILTRLGHKVNAHYGTNIAVDPYSNRLTLISDIITQKQPFKFEKGKINLLQEDFRFGEVLREKLEYDLAKIADIITYTLPGGFSPHIILERGEKNYNSIQAGLEMNDYVLAMSIELLKDNGRMIWAIRMGSQNPEKMLDNIDLDGLNLSKFKQFYDINKIDVINIDEQKENLKLDLPGYAIDGNIIRYSKDMRKIKNSNLQVVILLIEMIKKCGI